MELIRSAGPGNNQPRNGRGADFGYGFSTVQDPVWTLSQILLATGGRFISGRTEANFRSICTDSRAIEPGDLFLALAGEQYDGQDYVEQAIRKGAGGVIVSRPPEVKTSVPVVLVEDTLRALGDLAAYRRALMHDLQVMAITGSSGKTTVKEMAAAILGEEYNVLKTKGNFNNLVGLPLSLLPVDVHQDIAVLEMGMNQLGEIARLTEIGDPDIGCITNIQDAHLAGLDDISGVAKAKGELFAGIKAWGKLVVNADDKRVRSLARRCSQEKITYGRSRQAFIRATHIRSLGEKGMSFTLHIGMDKARIRISGLGVHNVMNGLAAAAMAYAVGTDIHQIVSGLEKFKPYDKRLQVQQLPGGLKLINDSYNANPASVLAALETVQNIKRGNKAVVILGDMLELGNQSVASHRFIGESIGNLGFDYLLAVGSYADIVVGAARQTGMKKDQAIKFVSKEEIADWLKDSMRKGILSAGDWILLKGSRGMQMETITADLIGKP